MTLKKALKIRKGDAVKPRSGHDPATVVERVSAGVTANADGTLTKTIYFHCQNGKKYQHREVIRVESPATDGGAEG